MRSPSCRPSTRERQPKASNERCFERTTPHDGVITLTPKPLIDRHIAEGLADLEAGRVHGLVYSAGAAVAALDKKATVRKKSMR